MRHPSVLYHARHCAALATLVFPAALGAQAAYDVSFPNAVHHEATIVFTLPNLPPEPVRLLMSRSSPGRYALHEFAKNVYAVTAEDGAGRPLAVVRRTPYEWEVADHDGTVRVTYTLFGDMSDGTYVQIDASHAHLNMPAAFMWARGHETDGIRVTFHPPAGSGWKIATQLVPADDPLTFTAPDLPYFMDSPTELSDFTWRRWTVRSAGRTDTLRMAVHHQGAEAEVDRYADMARQVVEQAIAVFGEPPRFDYG
ncbi:MAG: M61 family peptidase, partial [Gemmatimonadales bacterium]|nr:M61 family peptidase [Gemmatimonadales bacterium]